MTYQGHLPDGSSVQRHSAGGLYPFVLFAKDTPAGLLHGYIDPRDGSKHLVGTYDEAVAAVEYVLAFRAILKSHQDRVAGRLPAQALLAAPYGEQTGLLACDTPVPEQQGNDWLHRSADRQAAAAGLLDGPSHEAFTKPANDLARFA